MKERSIAFSFLKIKPQENAFGNSQRFNLDVSEYLMEKVAAFSHNHIYKGINPALACCLSGTQMRSIELEQLEQQCHAEHSALL